MNHHTAKGTKMPNLSAFYKRFLPYRINELITCLNSTVRFWQV